jgi:Fe-Mn family superoxide dismutase
MEYQEKKFNLPELKGISIKNIEEHLKLYAGYVKNTNLILSKIAELSKDETANAYVLGELQRRFGFEFNGMRNHEYYFKSLEGGFKAMSDKSKLKIAIEKEWGSVNAWLTRFKSVAMTRGIGWAVLYYDNLENRLLNAWVDEQHIGQLNGIEPVIMLDMWEHAFVYDYPTSEKKKYVEAFFDNLNWEVIENNFYKSLA